MDVQTELNLARAALEAVMDFRNATSWVRSPFRCEEINRKTPGTNSDHEVMLLAGCTQTLITPMAVLFECQQKLSGGSWGHDLTEVCTELRQLRDEYVLALCQRTVARFGGPRQHLTTVEDVKEYERRVSVLCETGPDCERYRDFPDRMTRAVARAEACIGKHIRRLDEELG